MHFLYLAKTTAIALSCNTKTCQTTSPVKQYPVKIDTKNKRLTLLIRDSQLAITPSS